MGEVDEGLVRRFHELETSQAMLREQLGLMVKEGRGTIERGGGEESANGMEFDVVGYFVHSPYRSILQHIGHAIHVCVPDTTEIIYWNQSAENLYGWKEYEVLGQKVTSLLINEGSHPLFEENMQRMKNGKTWSGLFPFKKRSEEMFMAMVTQTPLYENGIIFGVITVSSDSAILNDMNSNRSKLNSKEVHGKPKESKLNFRILSLPPQPQIASSVSNLASKIFPPNHANSNNWAEISQERFGCILEEENVESGKARTSASKRIFRLHAGLRAIEEKTYKYEETMSKFNQQSIIAAKVLSTFNIRGSGFQESDKSVQTTPINNMKLSYCTLDGVGNKVLGEVDTGGTKDDLNTALVGSAVGVFSANASKLLDHYKTGCEYPSTDVTNLANGHMEENHLPGMKDAQNCPSHFSKPKNIVQQKSSSVSRIRMQCSDTCCCLGETSNMISSEKQKNNTCKEQNGSDNPNHDLEYFREGSSAKATLQNEVEDCRPTSAASAESKGTSLVGRKEPNFIRNCDIHWEDLQLGEEVGQGSCAVVYRGAWNGSDVAIKVYQGNDYHEELLLDYQKEITIMKRLRHPNVLLFMGAVYSPERLAIVTEYLPRGSLFQALHRNNHKLDLKRHLRMALDVARGMNYLHRRNPPIIHRDLKSSNLLVDRNWTVKVGDFGLSCLKISTILTATSGKGTPQWMAPEVLRGECSNEKSDVFSFGVVLWELMTEAIPWSQLNPVQVIGVVGFQDRRLDLPEGMDLRVSAIIRDCWRSEPERRPTSEELVGRTTELICEMGNRRRAG